jgi:hypothetical protein
MIEAIEIQEGRSNLTNNLVFWQNRFGHANRDHRALLEAIAALKPLIEASTGLKNVRLVDAHSFCWIFSTLLKLEAEGSIAKAAGSTDEGRILGGREKSIIAMRLSVENTVKNANGQIVQRILKNKELRMTPAELEKLIASLLDLQDNCCALTGIPFQFLSPEADKNLLPSLDRVDSAGHYERGNLQVVCQFINFWKGDSDNAEFQRLLMVVRGIEAAW